MFSYFSLSFNRKEQDQQETRQPALAKEEKNIGAIVRGISDKPPAHFLWKIENFSKLSNAEELRSGEFYVDGYEWNLCLHVRSIEDKKLSNGKGHIMLRLVPCNWPSLPFYHKAWASFKLFVYDRIRDNYLTVHEDSKVRPIHGMKTGWGFNELIPLDDFYDESKGYLINDCCIFGAEVNVKDVYKTQRFKSTCVQRELGDDNTHTWKIKNFRKKIEGYSYPSGDFTIFGHRWRMRLYQERYWNKEKKGSLSLVICIKDWGQHYNEALDAGIAVVVKDQVHGEDHKQYGCKRGSLTWEFKDFISQRELEDESKGFICNGVVVFQVVISYLAITKNNI